MFKCRCLCSLCDVYVVYVVYVIMPLHAFNFLFLQYVCCILRSFVKSTELSGILGLKINIIIIIIIIIIIMFIV